MPITANFKQSAIRGSVVTLSGQALRIIVQITSVSLLARWLSPEDFGLIGMLASVLAFLQLLREFGISMAIVQVDEISQRQLSALFWFSLILGLILLFTVWSIANGLALFLGEPRLAEIAPIFGANFLIIAVGSVPLALMRRRLEFGRIALRDALSQIIAAATGITLAAVGLGYWALVIMTLVGSSMNTLMAWLGAAWLPRGRSATLSEIGPMLKFGGAFTVGEFANYACQYSDRLLIGKIWGLTELGYYTRAYALMLAPMGQVIGPVGTVILPILCKLKEQPNRFRHWVSELLAGAGAIMAVPAAFLISAAPEIVSLLLGPGWDPAIPIFRWLGLAVFFKPASSIVYWMLIASGNLKVLLRWTGWNSLLTVGAITVGALYGTVWVAACYALSGLILRVPLMIVIAGRTGLVDVKASLKGYLKTGAMLVVALCAFYAVEGRVASASGSDFVRLVIKAGLAFMGVVLILVAVPDLRLKLMSGISHLKSRFTNRA